ncbi:MAG: hypothetical protein A2297_00290 [Elusimicrobia bacterium RIFOXYB2_FULL_48_7]|nr:MAG: hypothetical protein A2297_00290 [Elusimicrobia bacterium RIFOXYB2_FULL_48_7]
METTKTGLNFGNLVTNGPQSLYAQISDMIEDKIIRKEIAIGQKLPPEEELCKLFNVSVFTVRASLSELVKKGLLARKQSRGTFVINTEPTVEFDLKKRNELCLIACPASSKNDTNGDISLSFFAYSVIKGLEMVAREKDLYLLYSTFNEPEFSLKGRERDIAGLILTGEVTTGRLKAIKKMKIPFLLIGDLYQQAKTDEQVDIISNDDFNGTYLAARHLLDLGHKRILYIDSTLDKYSWDIDYLNGYQHAYKETGLIPDKNLIIEAGKNTEDDAYIATKKFLAKSIPFTGLICLKGTMLPGIMKALDEKGLKVPGDVSLVNNGVERNLTATTVDFVQMGRTAVERIIERATNPSNWHPERIIVPYKIIQGNSTRKIEDVIPAKAGIQEG